MKTHTIFFLTFIIMFMLSACSGGLSSSQANLDGSAWILTAINNDAAIIGNHPTLEFEGDQVVGNASCNIYGGSYQVQGETISFGPLVRTEMYCMEPEGVMAQEQTYLGILSAAQRFELVEGMLTIYSDSEKTLTFQTRNAINVATSPPSSEQSNQELPTMTPEPVDTTPVHNFEPPAGFKEYRDTVVGISIYIPENWTVTGVIDGEYAIFQSYPEDKYVGGEGRELGDTKCDLNIRPAGTHAAELIQQWRTNPRTTIVSEDEFILQSGLTGQRFVIDSMGQATAFITELNQRVVILTCFGDFTQVDEIAVTLKASE
jgi:heat shock protein HslJ